ncbi:MAG TPA: hypothetical protein VK661_01415 [Planctomycetota bacterium]|nr:hypothetical protein [Planctomycetota bacterium]
MKKTVVTFVRRFTAVLLILASLTMLGFEYYVGRWNTGVVNYLLLACFALWGISPYGVFLLLGFVLRDSPAPSLICSIGAIVAVVLGMWVFYDGIFVHLDAQNALLFLFVPMYQWAWATVIAIISWSLVLASRIRTP